MIASSGIVNDVVSTIVPCYNEELFIEKCLRSIIAFSRPPGLQLTILVIDGGSTDSTVAIVQRLMSQHPYIQLIPNPGKTQSKAMNIGIKAATGNWIMRLDAHTVYPQDYLAVCYETALRTGAANVGGVCVTQPGDDSYQAKLIQALTTHKFGVGNSGFRTGATEGPRDTVPFGFFQRQLFSEIGTFNERLVRAQDYEYNCRIKQSGKVVWLNPKIKAYYFNQPTLRNFFEKQFFREAPYNAYMWYLAPYTFTPRHGITALFALGVLSGAAFAPLSPWIRWPYIVTMCIYGVLAGASSIQQAIRYQTALHLLCLPVLFFAYHFLHGIGVLWGGIRLLSHTSPVQSRFPASGLETSPR